jgi:hypothetical protein
VVFIQIRQQGHIPSGRHCSSQSVESFTPIAINTHMRATDIIRGLLDILDQIDHTTDSTPSQPNNQDDTTRRFLQITDLHSTASLQVANAPQEAYADITAVTTAAGGGVNGPKNPADLHSNSISMYPNFQACAKEQ